MFKQLTLVLLLVPQFCLAASKIDSVLNSPIEHEFDSLADMVPVDIDTSFSLKRIKPVKDILDYNAIVQTRIIPVAVETKTEEQIRSICPWFKERVTTVMARTKWKECGKEGGFTNYEVEVHLPDKQKKEIKVTLNNYGLTFPEYKTGKKALLLSGINIKYGLDHVENGLLIEEVLGEVKVVIMVNGIYKNNDEYFALITEKFVGREKYSGTGLTGKAMMKDVPTRFNGEECVLINLKTGDVVEKSTIARTFFEEQKIPKEYSKYCQGSVFELIERSISDKTEKGER